ncbi:aspartate ammonia-lyase [Spinactinospora alkalitolerans]|uniref:Aspartate ammonia-lyase n=1 Tax=Spinactinospora alkalitolerans TaxID=687207 RepID=A0A852U0Y5_9ACTN|nr:aspartate ammonia-lyase [Spinactinospora alkalitolerans]NYE49217.1 aspartate ammonia-lyase [Spinactinospora alkalitolerans]
MTVDAEVERTEVDSLGEVVIPADALWGVNTARAGANFPITGRSCGQLRDLVWAYGAVKLAACRANVEQGLLDERRGTAIESACRELMQGELDQCIIVDRVQGGAGTSTNMNVNEVVANRALQLLGCAPGAYEVIDPLDHVNRSQSTNDTYFTAVRLAIHRSIERLIPALGRIAAECEARSVDFRDIVKIGRTQLQDAVPMTLGQEFSAFAETIREDADRLEDFLPHLREINLGATAIGTGITAPVGYRESVVTRLSEISGYPLTSASDLIEATSDTGVFVLASGLLKRCAVKLSKISNDLRLLSSGPQAGLQEIVLPPVQAGSSIMPGKVNPVIPEAVNQVAFLVVGADASVTMAAEAGQLQLNAFGPVIASSLLDSASLLTRGADLLAERCVSGIRADGEFITARTKDSLAVATGLVPLLGYARTAALVKEALSSRRTLAELTLERGLLDEEQLNAALAPQNLTGEVASAR